MSDAIADRIEVTVRQLHEAATAANMWLTGDWRVCEQDAAVLLGVAPRTLRKMRDEGRGPAGYGLGDDDEGNENHEHGDVDRFTFSFEKTFGGDVVTGVISHENDGGGVLNHQTLTISNSTLSGNVAIGTSVVRGEDSGVLVDHNQDVSMGMDNIPRDFTGDFFV